MDWEDTTPDHGILHGTNTRCFGPDKIDPVDIASRGHLKTAENLICGNRNFLLKELSLWNILNCLIDGCAILEYGQDLAIDAVGQAQIPPSVNLARDVILHLDLKPENSES